MTATLDRLERVPDVGDEIELPEDGGLLRVERVDGNRIVRLRHVAPEPLTGGADHG